MSLHRMNVGIKSILKILHKVPGNSCQQVIQLCFLSEYYICVLENSSKISCTMRAMNSKLTKMI